MADKSNLNLYCQKKHISTPVYTHKQLRDGFSSTVDIEDTQYTSLFTHSTKKEAEKDAAAVASQAIINHRQAKSFDDVIKALDGVSISGSPWRQTTQQNTSVTTSSVTAPLSTSGRVINHVYHPAASTATLGPPPGFEMRRPPTTGHPPQGALIRPATTGHPPQAPTTGHPSQGALIRPPTTGHPPQGALIGPPTTVYPPQRSFIRPAIPVSINGPNIDRPSLNKPSSALPLSLRSPQQPVSCGSPPLVSASPLLGAGPLLGGQVTSDKDVKDLELYCQVSNLPPPIYTISKEKGRHVGRVRVGGMKFSRLWGYDTFDDAKDSAAVVAIAGIAMIQLQLSTQQGSQPVVFGKNRLQNSALSKGAPLSLTAVTVPVGATNPRHSTSPHSSHPPQLPHSPQLPHNPLAAQFQQTLAQPTQDLQTPSYFLHPIPRGPTQSTTPLQVNPQVTSLPHSSNLPQLNSLLPNLPQSSSLPPTVLTPSPAMTTDYKSLLNTFCQQHHYTAPVYECSSPSDTTGYISKVTVNGHIYQSSTHGTKKAADTEAARIATETLGVASAQEVGSTPPTVGTSSSAPPSIPSYISFKNLLQEKAQKEKLSHPNYSTERTSTGGGFVSTVTVHVSNGPSFQLSSSAQPVKKAAEQEAARKACEKLKMI